MNFVPPQFANQLAASSASLTSILRPFVEPVPVQKLKVTVYEEERELWSGEAQPPLEIGRQQEGDPLAMDLQDQVAYRGW